jgi:antibiotic biosynthesis monooxygenase (ABM) superfamily enzyme
MKARVKFVLLSWVAAFTIVMALFLAVGTQLQELPLALRALVISGVLVVSMTQVAIPLIMRFLRSTGRRAAKRRPVDGSELAPRDGTVERR